MRSSPAFALATRWAGRLGLLAVATFAVAACDSSPTLGTPPSAPDAPTAPPPAGVVLRVEYDETSVTTADRWPGDMAEARQTGDNEFLIRYENVHQAYQFDDDGDYRAATEYVEGNARTWLPQDFHEAVAEHQPMPGGEDPVVRYEIEGGVLRVIQASGAVRFETDLGPDAFRIPPEWVEALRTAEDTASAEARVAQARQALADQGVPFSDLGGDRVLTETRDQDGLVVRSAIDLRTGLAGLVETVLPDGRRALAEVRTYEWFGQTPIATHVRTYRYSDANGAWGVESKTETTRTNVVVNR